MENFDIFELMAKRHSVRHYTDKPIEGSVRSVLESEIAACNSEGGLNIQLVCDEPQAFGGFMAHYGNFTGVRNYFSLIGSKGADLDEKLGYYGERLVLKAQELGLNTCWVALTYSKKNTKCEIKKGEKLRLVISVGYGSTQGRAHKDRPMSELFSAPDNAPDWFMNGMKAAMLAPTATNQQKFKFTLVDGNRVSAKPTGGVYSKVDLGIVKYHFELGAGKDNFEWA